VSGGRHSPSAFIRFHTRLRETTNSGGLTPGRAGSHPLDGESIFHGVIANPPIPSTSRAPAEARKIAERIAANGPLAAKAILATIGDTATLPESDAFGKEMAHGMKVMTSEDAAEGPKAFLEQRAPVFMGR